jgi:hypothetical protein
MALAAFPATAQNLGIRLLRPYDGSSANIVSARCFDLLYDAEVTAFERVGNELRFNLQMPRNSPSVSFPEQANFLLALEHYVSPDEYLGERLSIRLTYRSLRWFSYEPPRSCTETFVRGAAVETTIPIESGWWVDFLEAHGTVGRGLMLDRASGRLAIRYVTYSGPASIDNPLIPPNPGIWISGAAREAGRYYSIEMTSYQGGVCIPCVRYQREVQLAVGPLILYVLTPTSAILAPPNEPTRLIEQAAFPSDRYPHRYQSSLTGRWAILGSEDALFGGFPIELGPEEEGQYFLSYPITFRFGSGRMHCDDTLVCKLYLRFTGLDHEFLLFEIPERGVGNQKLYVQNSQGTWRPVMVRID